MVSDDHSDGMGSDVIPTTAAVDGSHLGRRSVLKLAGAAVSASVLGLGAGTAAAAIDRSEGDGYEVWTVTDKAVYDLSDGEDLSNVLVDQTAAGACLTIRSRNKTDWTVRNVGFLGVGQLGDGANRFQLQVSTPADGSGRIENVWMNGKARNGQSGSELGGIFVRSSHAGHIDIRHTYIEGYGNNAVYASGPGKDGGNEGSVTLENCYHRDNTVSQYRIGTPDSVVRNCVGVVNDPAGDRGTYPWSDARTARGVWGKHFADQRVENSSMYVSPDDYHPSGGFVARYIDDRSRGGEAVLHTAGCAINESAPSATRATSNARVEHSGLGSTPSVSVIQGGGVPVSPQMAASGGRTMPPELPGVSDGTADQDDEAAADTDAEEGSDTTDSSGGDAASDDEEASETDSGATGFPTGSGDSTDDADKNPFAA